MTPEARMAEVFVELADTLVDSFDVVDFLHVVTERCVELLPCDAAGMLLGDQRGGLRVVAATTREVERLEVYQLQQDEGPCLDSFSTGELIANVDLVHPDDRWPVFSAAAVRHGFSVSQALPMRLRAQVIGALGLFNSERVEFTPAQVALGQTLADIATIGLLHERAARDQTLLSEQLQSALTSRVLIEQAKGVLSARAGTGVTEAFELMRSHARRNRRPLSEVASAVVAGTLMPEDLRTG
ncbi:GAF and ANTAR domain-containing protein [Modestobacter versicolor]|uniref:GAF and ANTAR domain-containing protein n=1 Tax=Modestobacter versicolor TaxID=429133 RepID=UPI0034DF03BF